MKRHTVLLLLAAGTTWVSAGAAEPEKTDPRHQQEIVSLRGKLGPGFTVKQVGMFVAGWDLDAAQGAQYEKLIAQLETALYENYFANRPEYIIKIVVFKDNESLRKNAKKVAEKSMVMPAGGFYLAYEKVLCMEATMGEWGLKHELTHALLHADLRREKVSPWLDEGIASLLESATLRDKEIELHLDWRLRYVEQVMKAQKLPHLADVLRMDFRSYNSPGSRIVGDAMARNLLFYLHEKGLLVQFYRLYRGNYGTDPSGVKFLEQVLKKKIDAVEADWLAWVSEQATKQPRPETMRTPVQP